MADHQQPQGDFAAGERAAPQGPPRDFAEGEEQQPKTAPASVSNSHPPAKPTGREPS
jgi:hypothetical protein